MSGDDRFGRRHEQVTPPHGVLGLDLARKYGWAYVGPDGSYIDSGHDEIVVHSHPGAEIHHLGLSIADLVTEFAPDFLAIEKPMHNGKLTSFKTARLLYAFAAIAAEVAWLRDLGFVEIQRTTCCKTILGNGRAVKADGVTFCRQFKPLLKSNDEADAIMIALAAHKMRDGKKAA